MLQLETEHPWVYKRFSVHGFHMIRQSDRFWVGTPSDLAIEQVLMRYLKTSGGLTGGRGVTESVRLIWLKKMHRCTEIHNSMSSLTSLLHVSSEQHVELGISKNGEITLIFKKLSVGLMIITLSRLLNLV